MMFHVNNKKLTALLAGMVCYGLSATVAQAVMIDEDTPDAGELVSTAQDTTGVGASLDSISGNLINLGTTANPVDDIDLFKIMITDPDAFSVTVTASLSGNNDVDLYLFNSAGLQLLYDDCNEASSDCLSPPALPQFNVGDLTNPPNEPGIYLLAINLFLTNPLDQGDATNPPNLDNGWFRDPLPEYQEGSYRLDLTGVSTAAEVPPVPEPEILALFGLGLAGLGLARRRAQA